MPITMIFDGPGVTRERADQVMERLRAQGVTLPVEGQLLHMSGPYNGGWRTIDVWESQEQFDAFFRDHLSVAFAETGGLPEGAPPQVFPVHELYT